MIKILCGIIAVVLLVTYNAVAVIKLQDAALAVVGLISIGMMVWDLWDDLKRKED
jgi:hypothetical protein